MKKIILIFTVILMCCTTLLQAQVCNKPTINSFSPVTGFIGSVVTIQGSNFDPIPANNQVFFGATQAEVLSASFGVLEVKVPVGATYGPITVRNACGLIGASPLSFNGIFCGTTITSSTYSALSYSANVSGGYQMISQDMDLDGKPDLLVCGFTTNKVSIMRNLSTPGNFNFAPKFDLAFQGATRCIAPGDFDGDGKIDLAVVDNGVGIRIYKNTSTPGNLSFSGPINYSAPGSYQMAAGDINGDGKMDLVYGSGTNIGTYRNTSAGGVISFVAAGTFSNTYYVTGVAIADVDGDGKADVGTSCPNDNRVAALRNTTAVGATTFSFQPSVSFPTNSSYPYRLFLGDFDKDGKIDFTTNNHSGGTVSVFRNTSQPGTISFGSAVVLSSPASNYRIGVGDADGDGNVDIVTKSSGVNAFSVYKNTTTGIGNISFAPRVDYSSQAEVSGILIGDLDGDYVPDIATSGISQNTLRVYRNNSTVVDNTAPTASCKNITVALSPAGTVTITPQMIDNGSSDACGIQSLALDKTNFTCADIGPNNVTLTVTDRAGNVSTCTAVVTVAPAAIIVTGQSTVCQGQTVTMNANPGDGYQWQKDGIDIPGATAQTYVATETGNYAVTVTNAGGCSGTSNAVSITVSPAPVVTTTPSGNATLCNGSLVITASAGSVYQWSNGATTQAITVTQAGAYTVTVTNQFGCTNTSAPVVVGATDNVPPVAKCKNITVAINSNGTAAITAASINDGSFDNCSAVNLSVSGQTTYSCADVGNTFNVVLTVTDAQGNQSSCTATVTVTDPGSYCNQPPVAICKPLTVSANANCMATATALDFNNGSSDPNGDVLTYSVFPAGPYAKGVTNVVLTVTDSKGASSTCATTITVVDDLAAVVVLPANVTVNADAGVCFATNVSIGTPTVTDNCVGWTVTNDAPVQFGKGVTNVTWTVTDASGNKTTAVQTVTVNDVEKPVINGLPSNITASNDAGVCGASVNWTAATVTDNCSGATITSSHAPGQLFPVGSTTVTYTATDASGNSTSGSFTITVADTEKPAITAPAAILVNNDAGQCTAVVNLGNAVATDNCGVQSVVNNAPAIYPVGSTTITWTVTDIYGNVSTATQVVTVVDAEKPTIACAASQVFCANTGGNNNYTIPVLVQSDNCGIASTSYVVTGATSRAGNGTDASGVFAIGTSIVTYTVTDIHGNSSSCSVTVKINPLPVATVQAASPNVFCNEFTLTGSGNQNGPFTYNWSLNGNAVGAGQVLTLGLTNPDGLYKLSITDANGCTSEFPTSYQYNKQNLTNSYTILAYKEVKLGAYNKVETGSVGVMSSKGEAEFKKYSSVNGAGSFVKSPEIDKDKGVTILNQINGVATVSLPAMQYNTSVTKYLPNYSVGNNTTVTLNGNFNNLTIRKGANATLNGTVFGTIKVEEGASVKFTAAQVNIEELRVDKGSRNTISYVRFVQTTSIRVSKKVSVGSDVIVNPDYHNVTFYMGDQKCDDEKFYVKGDDTKIIANVYMPNGKLKIRGGNGNDDDDDRCDHRPHSAKHCKHNSNKHGHRDCDHGGHGERDCEDNVHMIGLFIAEEVESEGKNVIWNNFSCSAPAPVVTLSKTTTSASISAETVKQPEVKEAAQLQVIVMPNPSASVFTLKLQSKNNAPVQLRITDAAGRAVENRANLGANSTVQVGGNFISGTYYAEFIQGNQRKVVQLIKVRR